MLPKKPQISQHRRIQYIRLKQLTQLQNIFKQTNINLNSEVDTMHHFQITSHAFYPNTVVNTETIIIMLDNNSDIKTIQSIKCNPNIN